MGLNLTDLYEMDLRAQTTIRKEEINKEMKKQTEGQFSVADLTENDILSILEFARSYGTGIDQAVWNFLRTEDK